MHTSSLTIFFMVTGRAALKWTWRPYSDLGSITPWSVATEKSSPRFSKPFNRHCTGSNVLLRRNTVFVSFLLKRKQYKSLRYYLCFTVCRKGTISLSWLSVNKKQIRVVKFWMQQFTPYFVFLFGTMHNRPLILLSASPREAIGSLRITKHIVSHGLCK
jgi:hypothetical protein